MAEVTRRIGLSLGADICWPICYEGILERLDLALALGTETVRFEVERLPIEPFDLRQPCRYDVVIDRLTHWLESSREWIKKSVTMDGLYVLNNPWSVQSMEKLTTYCAMIRLGLPIPETWLVPAKSYPPSDDLARTLESYAKLFNLEAIGGSLGYPLFMKPYDGGAWRGVSKIDDAGQLKHAYDQSGEMVMHLQQAVEPFDLFVRCIGLGPQAYAITYDPSKPIHERYLIDFDFLADDEWAMLRDMTMTINAFFGWDFNSCEVLRRDNMFHPIDFANPCPDSQVTSLHYHFPWVVKANLKWSIYCAATKKAFRLNLDWQPFFEIAESGLPFAQRLAAYAAIADERFERKEFESFCDTHLAHLDRVVLEFFRGDVARGAIRKKVEAMFSEHEWDQFTDHFAGIIDFWCRTEQDRLENVSAK